MRIATAAQYEATRKRRVWGTFPVVLLLVFAALAIIVPIAIVFWPDGIDPEVRATLQFIRAGQQQATNGITALNDSLAVERAELKKLSDQSTALAARVSTLQDAMTRIQRDNAELTEQLKVMQTQMAQETASVTEQIAALTQLARDTANSAAQLNDSREQTGSILARVSDESLQSQAPLLQPPLPQRRPTLAVPKRKPIAPAQARIRP